MCAGIRSADFYPALRPRRQDRMRDGSTAIEQVNRVIREERDRDRDTETEARVRETAKKSASHISFIRREIGRLQMPDIRP